jgi:hypothetical protein
MHKKYVIIELAIVYLYIIFISQNIYQSKTNYRYKK